ncbi:MAG: Ig-like domain-containing protein [Woeseiaceae bacterium]
MENKNRTLLRQLSTFTLITILMAACGGGSGSGVTANPPPPLPPPPPPPPAFNPVFSDIQANIFTPTCATAGCHAGAGAPQGLVLDDANSFALLVGVASNEVPAVLRVAAGDPGNSYLIQKLEGNAASGAQMPLNGTPLPQATIDIVRQWIIDGAVDDRATSSTPIRVSSLSPVPGSDLTSSPSQLLAGFDRELDASSVSANSFVLEASGGDNTFGDGNETAIVAASVSVPGTNPSTAVFDLTGVTLADETYQVQLLGSGPSIIMDLDANALDGEFSGAFPSGDGTAGGDFTATFSVTTPSSGNATLAQIQANVFTPTCATAGCHAGGSPPQGLNLEDGNSFTSLVGVASSEVPAILRVAAGDPDNSYLIQKIEGSAAVGSQMPLGGAALDPAVIADIRQWITDGANQ